MRAWIACLALLPACGFKSTQLPDGNGGMDAGMEGTDAPLDAQPCFGSFVKVCLSTLPTGPLMFPSSGDVFDINTDPEATGQPCDPAPANANYCVVAATAINVPSLKTIRAHGARPLVLVAIGAFELFGNIDVSSSATGPVRGAGASMTVCTTPAAPTPATVNSGGFGGSFGGRGGDGEEVDGNRGVASAALSDFPAELRGGCPGGDGGSGGVGGLGGGAVSIYGATIRINGQVNASGAGGRGGPQLKSGGGGGGSGGMIVLDVPQSAITLESLGRLFANGGGGGEGGAGTNPDAGPGADGRASTAPNVAGQGGNGGNAGGNGGAGSSGGDTAGSPSAAQSRDDGGGGAGGGGAGFVHAAGISGNNVIAPPSRDTPQ